MSQTLEEAAREYADWCNNPPESSVLSGTLGEAYHRRLREWEKQKDVYLYRLSEAALKAYSKRERTGWFSR